MRTAPKPDLRIFYALLIVVGGVLAHVALEFASMGSDADAIVFSPRHWYLGLGVLVGICVFIIRSRAVLRAASGVHDLRRIVNLGVNALPLRGKGARFYALTAFLQFAIGSITQIGEGCPLCGHDLLAGALGALATVVLLALISRELGRRLPSLVCSLVGFEPFRPTCDATSFVSNDFEGARVVQGVWFPLLFNRPPPRLRSLTASQ